MYRLFAGALTAVALIPLVWHPIAGVQDLPQHLLQTAILYPDLQPGADYATYYDAQLHPGPYAAFFWLVGGLARLLGLAAAGKAVLGVSVMLLGLFAASAPKKSDAAPPWALLLLLPLAFGPMWFLGFANYTLSLPLLLFALRAGTPTAAPATRASIAAHVGWLIALFFTHPFTLLVACGLTLAPIALDVGRPGALGPRRSTAGLTAWALPPILISLTMGVWWWIDTGTAATDAAMAPVAARWLPAALTGRFAGTLLWGVGQQLSWVWIAGTALMVSVPVWATRYAPVDPQRRRIALQLALCAIGVAVLPYSRDHYTYVNLRLLAPIALLWPMWAARVTLAPRALGLLALAIALLLGESVYRQHQVSAEKSDLLPLLAQMAPNARVLPLAFDHDSAALDRDLFDPHLHDHLYYHLEIGGGFSPYLFESRLNPARFKPGQRRPAPGEYQANAFAPMQHGADYQWFLARGAPEPFVQAMQQGTALVGQSGAWTLFKRR